MEALRGDMSAGNALGGKKVGVGFYTGVALFVNFTIGSGFLTVPWAFYESGPLLGLVITSIIILFQWVSNSQTLEAHARANKLEDRVKYALLQEEEFDRIIADTARLVQAVDENNDGTSSSSEQVGEMAGADEGYTVTTQVNLPVLIGIFLGKKHMTAYTMQFTLANYMTLWLWVAVFATSWATYVPFGGSVSYEGSYVIYCAIVMCIQTPWSMLSLQEQSEVQVVFFWARILIFFLCFFTVIVAWSADINSFDLGSENASYSPNDNGLWLTANMYIVTTVLTFCSLNNYALPALIAAVKNKRDIKLIIVVVGAICFVVYNGFGFIFSLYFGDNIVTPISELWENFTGFSDATTATPLYAQVIAGYIVILPSLDVMSAYAMVVAIACDNTLYLVLGPEETNLLMRENKSLYYFFRGLSAALPAVGAMAVSDLGYLTVVGGLCCFLLQFIYSPMLSRASKEILEKLNIPTKTEYTLECGDNLAWWMVVGGSAMFMYLILAFSIQGVPSELT